MRADTKRGIARLLLLATSALCGWAGCYDSSGEAFGGESHFLRCERQAQCEHLGPEYSCREGYCMPDDEPAGGKPPMIGEDEPGSGAPSGSAGDDGASDEPGPLPEDSPLVLFVIDTSGSMERLTDCECTTPGCEECLPDCNSGQRNRWAQTLEALTGNFDDFACEPIDRGGFAQGSYDFGYYLPYHRPSGTQRDDGVLDQYRDRARFGLTTFDGWDTWAGAAPLVEQTNFDFNLSAGQAGLWSYNPEREIAMFTPDSAQPHGSFRYPKLGETCFMDTGIRSERAESGGLQLATDAARAGASNAAIQRSLLAVRPYGGTPVAASLDDVYYLITQDPRMAGERARNLAPHVLLITDGYPDDDYRTFGCDCAILGNCPQGIDALAQEAMACPYPLPEDAARALRCGRDAATCDAPIANLHVVSLAATDPAVIARLDAIAVAGGQPGARFAADGLDLRNRLDELLGEIVE
jgi:type IV pilus assembly protein PilY1